MAVKGRRQGRAGAAPGAPRPKIEPRRTPWHKQRAVRLAGLAVVVIAALLGGLKLWGNLRRSGDLRTYTAAVSTAMEPFVPFARAGDPQRSFQDVHTRFEQGDFGVPELRELSARWVSETGKARDAIRVTKAPTPVRDTNEMLAQSLDLFAASAELYDLAADQRELAQRDGTSRAQRERIEEQVTATLAQILSLRSRAQANMQAAFGRIEDLKRAWGVTSDHPRSPFSVPEGVPGGGL